MNDPTPNFRHDRLVCVLSLLLMPVLLFGAIGAFRSNTNNILDWLPISFTETQRLFKFVERFGSDEILLISWEGCTLDDSRLEQVAAALVEPATDPQTGESYAFFRKVFTGRETLKELTSKPLRLSEEEAVRRMRGWLVGPDGRTTCVLALVSEPGSWQRAAAIRYVHQVTAQAGIAQQAVHLGGPTADAVAIDEASNRGMLEMAFGSALVGLLVAWRCLHSLKLIFCILYCAVFAWSASLSAVYFGGTNMDAILLMMPALVFVLAVSGGVHLTNYFTDALGEASEHPTEQAIRHGRLPCVLAAATTAVGLGSLMMSQLAPVRKFGFFASLGMLLIVLALLVLWPALLRCWPSRWGRHEVLAKSLSKYRLGRGTGTYLLRRLRKNEPVPDGTGIGSKQQSSGLWWSGLYYCAVRYASLWILGFFCLLPALGYGLTQIKTSVQLVDLFGPQSTPVQSGQWLQKHVGALTPVEIVLVFERSAEEDSKDLLRRAQITEQFRTMLLDLPEVSGAVAATTFAPPLPVSRSARDLMLQRVIAARLVKHRDRLEQLHFLTDDAKYEYWRISTRVSSLNTDYGRFLKELDRSIDHFLSEQMTGDVRLTVDVTGGVPLIHMAQQQLLTDLYRSFLLAFLLITLTMVVLVRSVLAGILLMIPNVFPALATFSVMGFIAFPVDIGTMMTASAAMGIAVDDTLHFMVWFRRALAQGRSRRQAVKFAFRYCATAMVQTSIICGLALTVFMLSPFAPIGRFGLVMAIMLALALFGDLVLLPALLAGPLGRWFGKGKLGTEPPTSRTVKTVSF